MTVARFLSQVVWGNLSSMFSFPLLLVSAISWLGGVVVFDIVAAQVISATEFGQTFAMGL